MADAAVAGISCSSFSVPTVISGRKSGILSTSLRDASFEIQPLSFPKSVSRSLRTTFPLYSSRPRALQVYAVVGYPASMRWWKKGDHPNLREIHSAEDFVDSLTKAGDRLVLVDFFSTGCRSCKAMHPKICQIAADNPDIEVLKVDFYDNNALCRSLNVNILPFYHFYRGAEGRLDAFSCSLPKVGKLRAAVAKYKNGSQQTMAPLVAKQENRLIHSTPRLVAAGSAV